MYSPSPNMGYFPEKRVRTGSIVTIPCPVYSNLRIPATVSHFVTLSSTLSRDLFLNRADFGNNSRDDLRPRIPLEYRSTRGDTQPLKQVRISKHPPQALD